MKELAIQMAREFPLHAQEIPSEPIRQDCRTEILCPNCTREHLEQINEVELGCTCCGQQFVIVDKNTVKFK